MIRRSLLLAAGLLAGCNGPVPYSNTVGMLPRGATMTVIVARGDLVAYKPAVGEPLDAYTVSSTALDANAPPAAPVITRSTNGIDVNAAAPLQTLLLRIPDGVNLDVHSKGGNVSVTDISGNPNVHAVHGNINMMVSGYAQAETAVGDITATLGSTQWPGTLRFNDGTGDVVVWIVATAKFRVRLHTDDGTLFSDFSITGSSHGNSETIDQNVNGGGPRAIDIEVHQGTIRLMRLEPQA